MSEFSKSDIEAIRKSGLFDEQWYLQQYPDVKALGMDPAEHYLRFGAKLGRRPSPRAEKGAHLNGGEAKAAIHSTLEKQPARHIQVRAPETKPVPLAGKLHPTAMAAESYLAMRQDIAASGLWDEKWYLSRYYFQFLEFKRRAGADRYISPLDHYLLEGWRLGFEPSDTLPIPCNQVTPTENKVSFFLNTLRFRGYQFEKNIWIPSSQRVADHLAKRDTRKARGVVYTCIVGQYDELMQPYQIADDWDYVCFTDDPDLVRRRNVGVWEIRPLSSQPEPAKANRWHKMHPHLLFPDHKESIYVDGNINIISNYIYDQIDKRGMPILLPAHFIRNCIYKEIDALVHSPRFDEPEKRQFKACRDFLLSENFPVEFGLTENNLIYRKHHDPAVVRIMSQWWDCYNKHPPRDQTSLAYVFWKNRLDLANFTFANCRVNYRDFWVVKHNTTAVAPNAGARIATKALRPAFARNNIGVVFSTNEYFVPYLGVAIFSLIKNASHNYNYDIIILGRDLSGKAQQQLGALAKDKSNISIRFYDMGDIFDSLPKDIFHVEGYVPVETYNKCFITKVLSGYDRCVYLDSDIVVLDDVQKLHDIALDGRAIGASVNVANVNAAYCRKEIKGRQFDEYLQKELGVIEQEKYFQAGILVLDMQALADMNLFAASLAALKEVKQPVFFDQCIFNRLFYNNVKFISTGWNHVWYMQNYSYLRGSVPDDVFFDYARGRTDPKIIHFASKDKPHTKLGWELGDIFWKYAYESPFIGEILRELREAKGEVAAAAGGASSSSWYHVPPRVLIHVHLYYVDQLDKLLDALANVTGCDYSLYVTMVEKSNEAERRIKERHKDATIMIVPNVGYDIYPFLHVLQQVRLANYNYILKLHTKNRRDPGQDTVYGIKVPGYQWRDELIHALAGSKDVFRRNLSTLLENKKVGCLGAKRFVFSTTGNREEETYKLSEWRKKCGVAGGQHYVGGSMFFARAYPFERLKGLRLRPEDFKAPTMGTKDYKNTAHIVERLLGIVVESEGFEIRGT